MKKAYAYTRISSKEQSNFSLSGQTNINERYATSHDIEIIKTYEDDGVSGKNFNRPAWKAMMKDLKKKEVSFIIVAKYDRLGRNAAEALGFIQTIEESNRVRILSAMEHFSIDPDHPFYFKMRADMLVNADFERRVIAERTKFGIWNGKSEGRHLTGAPYGYMNERDDKNKPIIVPHPINRAIVAQMFESFLKGATMTEVYREAIAAGFSLRSKMATQRLLENPIYVGNIIVPAYKKDAAKIIKGLHEPLVSEMVFLQVQNIINTGDQKHVIDRDELPLRAWLLCQCGKALTGARSLSKTGRYFWYYRCNYCKPAVSSNAIKVDAQMVEILQAVSLTEQFVNAIVDAAIAIEKENSAKNIETAKGLKIQIANLKEKIDSIEEKYINDRIEETTYKKWKTSFMKELQDKIGKLEGLESNNQQLISLIKSNTHLLTDLGTMYENATAPNKKKLLKVVFPLPLMRFEKHYETLYLNDLFSHNVLNTNLLQIKKDGHLTVLNGRNCISTLYDTIMKLKTSQYSQS